MLSDPSCNEYGEFGQGRNLIRVYASIHGGLLRMGSGSWGHSSVSGDLPQGEQTDVESDGLLILIYN